MKKKRTIDDVVRDSLCLQLKRMQEDDGHIHGGWTGGALASWVAPGVIAAVKRHLSAKKGKKP